VEAAMDQITGVRICPIADSEHWEVQLRFASGRVSLVRVGSLAGAIASASLLRRPPTLTVVEGGRTIPLQASQPSERKLSVIVGSKAG
jgi:hypothetical protein